MTDEALFEELDDALARVRIAGRRPTYRGRILSSVQPPGGLVIVRVLRAVEQLADETCASVGDIARANTGERAAVEARRLDLGNL